VATSYFEPVGVDGQATVDPEAVDNIELGFQLDLLDSRMRFNGAIYRTDFDNMQLRQVVLDSGDTPRVVFRNASETTYSFAVQYTLDTELGTFIPRLGYSYADEIFMGLHVGAGQNEDQTTFDDYSLVNFRLGWRYVTTTTEFGCAEF